MADRPTTRLDYEPSLAGSRAYDDNRRAVSDERQRMAMTRTMQRQYRRAIRHGDMKTVATLGSEMEGMGMADKFGSAAVQSALQQNDIAQKSAGDRTNAGLLMNKMGNNPGSQSTVRDLSAQAAQKQAEEAKTAEQGKAAEPGKTAASPEAGSTPSGSPTVAPGGPAAPNTKSPAQAPSAGYVPPVSPAVQAKRDAVAALKERQAFQANLDRNAAKKDYSTPPEPKPVPATAKITPEVEAFTPEEIAKANAIKERLNSKEETEQGKRSQKVLDDVAKSQAAIEAQGLAREETKKQAEADMEERSRQTKIRNAMASEVQKRVDKDYFSDAQKNAAYNESLGWWNADSVFGKLGGQLKGAFMDLRSDRDQPAPIDYDKFDLSKPNFGQDQPIYRSDYGGAGDTYSSIGVDRDKDGNRFIVERRNESYYGPTKGSTVTKDSQGNRNFEFFGDKPGSRSPEDQAAFEQQQETLQRARLRSMKFDGLTNF